MTLGYLVPEFPSQTHAFFWRELSAIEDLGTPVRVYSTRRPPETACPHRFRPADPPKVREAHAPFEVVTVARRRWPAACR